MANTIGLNYANLFQSYGLADKRPASAGKSSVDFKNSAVQSDKNFSVELSDSGLNALANLQTDSVDDATSKGLFQADEKKLSAKAQAYLDKLREKYDNYDFVIADDVDDPQSFSKQSDKGYSVILSTEEIEKMAEDDEFADKIMGQVDKAAGTLDELSEKSLGEGMEFSSLAAEVDEEGNMKLFASIEKMSEDQRARLEELKEKRAEENKESDSKEDTEKTEPETFSFKSANVEANSASELMEKIFGINWDDIAEETFAWNF